MEFSKTKCGNYRIELLNRENFKGALEVIRVAFCQDEALSIATEVNLNPAAVEELLELCADTALDGVSLVSVREDSGQVVAVSFNKLQVPSSDGDEECFFEMFAKEQCQQSSAQSLISFMATIDDECNLFEKYKVDCSLEIMFLATLKEHRRKGLAELLVGDSMRLAEQLQTGPVSAMTVEDLGPKYSSVVRRGVTAKKPKICQAIWTGIGTQRLGRKLGWTVESVTSYEKFVYNGKTYADRLGPENSACELASIRLNV